MTANATNAVALWPASLAGAWAARDSLRPLGRYLLPLLAAGLAGGLLGGLLLLVGGDAVFAKLIPWLLLAATCIVACCTLLALPLPFDATVHGQTCRVAHTHTHIVKSKAVLLGEEA